MKIRIIFFYLACYFSCSSCGGDSLNDCKTCKDSTIKPEGGEYGSCSCAKEFYMDKNGICQKCNPPKLYQLGTIFNIFVSRFIMGNSKDFYLELIYINSTFLFAKIWIKCFFYAHLKDDCCSNIWVFFKEKSLVGFRNLQLV